MEDLGDRVELSMVQIPGGEFWMGQTEAEKELLIQERGEEAYKNAYARELPRHRVTVPQFFLGQYPVTQAQWRMVASLPKVAEDLHPEPSHFQGDQRPVEQVSWYEAEEFCKRLEIKTGRPYRLPSEAEWEYACRAGTETLYHFGDVISTDVVNYDGRKTFSKSERGVYLGETTEVGQLGYANDFGLFDMHGNILEWCADHFHNGYESSLDDLSIWLFSDEASQRILRGGSWAYYPRNCRSGVRYDYYPGYRSNLIGFRVACAPA
jgi:formylglycine-generating enzyme required for sulfatase activity